MNKTNKFLKTVVILVLLFIFVPSAKSASGVNTPSDQNWKLIGTDNRNKCQSNKPCSDLKAIYGKVENHIIYFKVVTFKNWSSLKNVDFRIFIDPDTDEGSGDRANFYGLPDPQMGADGVIIIGNENWPNQNIITEFWRYNDFFMEFLYTFPLAYLDFPENSNQFVVGIYYDDMARAVPGSVMGPVKNTIHLGIVDTLSDWDWIPNRHYLSFDLGPSPDSPDLK